MQFLTKVPISKSNFSIDYNSKIMSFGSCFAENIGAKLNYFKFQNTTNPFGIIFNPVSIEKLVNRIVNKIEFSENDIFYHNDLWHCYDVHSKLSHPNKDQFLQILNSILNEAFNQTLTASHFIFTYGTSWVYRNKSSEKVVANCHKVAQNQFDKELLSVEIIQESIRNTIELIQKINSNCNFIFTISPVRHIKDGFVENTISKSHLITAIHNTQFKIYNYFPSYEIMVDELRDYRFYADDMLHPSAIAIQYIWERFAEAHFSENTTITLKQIDSIQKSLQHKPFNPESESHQIFLKKLHSTIEKLQENHPKITF